MEEPVVKLNENILNTNKLSLDFFMYLPEGIWMNQTHDGIRFQHTPMLIIRCKQQSDMLVYDYKRAGYHITVLNYYQTMKFFNQIMKWLYDDAYNDLFMIRADNQLIFNADYKSLHAITSNPKNPSQYLRAVPSVVEINGKSYEGVDLFVNTTDYRIQLSFEEFGILFGILEGFDFSSETTKMLTMFEYVIKHHAVKNYQVENRTPFD